jgi:hypothetical protein
MLKVIMLVSVPVAIAITIGNAFADNPNVPTWSPYTLMAIDGPPPIHAYSGMAENRAAAVQVTPNVNAPTWSPYTMTPQGQY